MSSCDLQSCLELSQLILWNTIGTSSFNLWFVNDGRNTENETKPEKIKCKTQGPLKDSKKRVDLDFKFCLFFNKNEISLVTLVTFPFNVTQKVIFHFTSWERIFCV